jgi:hypothetical protein
MGQTDTGRLPNGLNPGQYSFKTRLQVSCTNHSDKRAMLSWSGIFELKCLEDDEESRWQVSFFVFVVIIDANLDPNPIGKSYSLANSKSAYCDTIFCLTFHPRLPIAKP